MKRGELVLLGLGYNLGLSLPERGTKTQPTIRLGRLLKMAYARSHALFGSDFAGLGWRSIGERTMGAIV